jgi:hypothetical protein
MLRRARKSSVARLNIYVPDPTIRRQVKAVAAKQDISVSEYCLRAITRQLIRDGERVPRGEGSEVFKSAVARARRFQADTFGGQVFRVSSADLIREAREGRAGS